MGAPSDTNLTSTFRAILGTNYRRTDLPLGANAKDDLNYVIEQALTNGRGTDKADLQWSSRRNLVDDTELIDPDGVLTNIWGHTLDYDAIKLIIIKNRETDPQRYLDVTFKNERYIIGAGGFRIIGEPISFGVQSTVSSSSFEEGYITVTAVGNCTYDIFIIGSSGEQSSSSGGT